MRALTCLAFLLVPAAAHADKPYTHDGFQLTFGAGINYGLTATIYQDGDDQEVQTTLEGVGIGGMLLAGYTVAEGLVVGGGTMGGHVFSPSGNTSVDDDDGSDVDGDSDMIFNLVGPYVDYYANDNDGLHGLVLVGLATVEDGSDATDGIALGGGIVLGAGYDWWIAEEWSMGVLGRLHYLVVDNDVEVDGETYDASLATIAAGLLLTAAWH